MTTLCVVLGDQLNQTISSLRSIDKQRDIVLMAEVFDEATYVKHHKKKIALVFSAMRHFAKELQESGYQVRYIPLDDAQNSHSIKGEVAKTLEKYPLSRVVITEPAEYRLWSEVATWSQAFGVGVDVLEDDRFMASIENFHRWAEGRKQLRMEYFYREMRKTYKILMEDGKPVGGKWNFDKSNRKALPPGKAIPQPTGFQPDNLTQDVIRLVGERFTEHFGDLEPFEFAVTRQQALKVLESFVDFRLADFGDYQDAMKQNEPWLFHSHISFYLNCGLLLPSEVISRAETAYYSGCAPLNAVEGFIRQILGWREYVRGLYWYKMPEYKSLNFLQAHRPLPELFWGAETKMNCLGQCVKETRENAYAHHIQRLMVLGNFALLAGLEPDQVNEWYLIVYADAYEWVELPNVSGMILFADGGLLASKPYSASGAYINKMSDYCQHCVYQVDTKHGPSACPFNYLYWHFLLRNQDKLAGNPRLGMPYRTLNNMSDEKRDLIIEDAERFFLALENNEKV